MSQSSDATFFGHPRGLATLFFTEMWERFSYYGMRALLILFLADATKGGMGLGTEEAGALYGLYTFGVYALALAGGWVADRLIGQRKAVLYGGVLIAMGHYSMAIPANATFYAGLLLIVLGTGLLKPNVSAIVGDLYGDDSAKRDAGFSIFYMGINLGAFFGPIVCSYLGEATRIDPPDWVNWHYGFGAAGVGMTLALVQYVLGQKYISGCGELKEDSGRPEQLAQARKAFSIGASILVVGGVALGFAFNSGALSLTSFASYTGGIVAVGSLIYFAAVIAFVCKDGIERRRVGLCALLFVGAAMFWSGFEQAGSSMNLFAADYTDRTLMSFDVPAGWLQSVNALFIILLAPVMGMVWVKLGARNPSIPIKFGLGLVLLGVGFLVMMWGSAGLETDAAGKVVEGSTVGMRWLVVTYFMHTVGELCLSPVGLSSVTKLSPPRLVGQMMGTWFMGAALGNLIAGLVAGGMESMTLVGLFGTVAAIAGGAGLVFLVFCKPMNWLSAGVK
jgi:POT family proton-dependent oligopeptide transporter